MSNIKKIIAAGIALIVIAVLFFVLIVNSVAITLQSIINEGRSTELLDAVSCTITGTRSGDSLDLKLTYDSFTVEGITGTISESGKTFSNVHGVYCSNGNRIVAI